MKISIASDHGGYELKNEIIEHIKKKGIEIIDKGTNSHDSVDYPTYAKLVCDDICEKKSDLGILVCGTGIGMSIAANKINSIRAAVVSDEYSAKMARAHNNANVLALGARVIGMNLAFSIVDAFIETNFEGGRHQKRLDIIKELEKNG